MEPSPRLESSLISQELMVRYDERWRQCDSTESPQVLRLAVLRDWMRDLHAEKSRCLALGKKSDALMIRSAETQIEQLRDYSTLHGELAALMNGPKRTSKRNRRLPEALFSWLPRDRFERYDRVWETAIASEASLEGWRFWALSSWVKIEEVQKWDLTLQDRLWPHGISLFSESEPSHAELDPALNLWHGRWILVIHPHYKHPSEMRLELERIPGFVASAPTPYQWKLLFSPKKR